jgi:exodeoxyribonuclease VII large subunit
MKTPTAVAEFLISGALKFWQELKEIETHFGELITDQLEEHRTRLSDATELLNSLVNQMIIAQQNRLGIAGIHLANRTESFLKDQQSELNKLIVGTKNIIGRFVTGQTHQLDHSVNKLNYIFREKVLMNKNMLNQFKHLVKIRTLETIRYEKKNLDLIQDKLRLVDPQNILKRGYSLTMLNGKIIKSVQQVNEGDLLETWLGDGIIESNVKRISK